MESRVEGKKEAGGPFSRIWLSSEHRGEKEEKGRDYYNHKALLQTKFFL